ncbi:hypothetical protein P3G55_18720 [Leptospira sp. 96542]|nr:hypothetical protein [Leptospira sp. 96542]
MSLRIGVIEPVVSGNILRAEIELFSCPDTKLKHLEVVFQVWAYGNQDKYNVVLYHWETCIAEGKEITDPITRFSLSTVLPILPPPTNLEVVGIHWYLFAKPIWENGAKEDAVSAFVNGSFAKEKPENAESISNQIISERILAAKRDERNEIHTAVDNAWLMGILSFLPLFFFTVFYPPYLHYTGITKMMLWNILTNTGIFPSGQNLLFKFFSFFFGFSLYIGILAFLCSLAWYCTKPFLKLHLSFQPIPVNPGSVLKVTIPSGANWFLRISCTRYESVGYTHRGDHKTWDDHTSRFVQLGEGESSPKDREVLIPIPKDVPPQVFTVSRRILYSIRLEWNRVWYRPWKKIRFIPIALIPWLETNLNH